jgi:hypothetical protein
VRGEVSVSTDATGIEVPVLEASLPLCENRKGLRLIGGVGQRSEKKGTEDIPLICSLLGENGGDGEWQPRDCALITPSISSILANPALTFIIFRYSELPPRHGCRTMPSCEGGRVSAFEIS